MVFSGLFCFLGDFWPFLGLTKVLFGDFFSRVLEGKSKVSWEKKRRKTTKQGFHVEKNTAQETRTKNKTTKIRKIQAKTGADTEPLEKACF